MSSRLSSWSSYGLAVLFSAAAFALRHALASPTRPLFILMVLPTLLSGFLAGFGPAILATALTATGAAWLLLHPDALAPAASAADLVQWLVLCGVNGAATVTIERLRRASARTAEARDRADAAQMGTFVCESSDGAVTWDEPAQRTFGLSDTDRFSYQRGLAMVHPEDQERVRAAAASALSRRGPGVMDVQYRCVWPDGTVHWRAIRREEAAAGTMR